MKRQPSWLLILAVAAVPTCAPVATATQTMQEGPPPQMAPATEKPPSDAWITTKVKAALVTAADVPGMDIRVETQRGTVTLSGHVPTQEQADRAVATARRIDGVQSVDSSALIIGDASAGH